MNMLYDDLHLVLSILAKNLTEGADEREAVAVPVNARKGSDNRSAKGEFRTKMYYVNFKVLTNFTC